MKESTSLEAVQAPIYERTLGIDYDLITEEELIKHWFPILKRTVREEHLDDSDIIIRQSLTEEKDKKSFVIKFPHALSTLKVRRKCGDCKKRIEYAIIKQKALNLDFVPDVIFIKRGREYKRRPDLEEIYENLE